MAKLKPNRQTPAPSTTKNLDTPAPVDADLREEAAAAVAASEGSGTPLARIGPEPAVATPTPSPAPILPPIDPVAAASARLKDARADAAGELAMLARKVAAGDADAESVADRVASLLEAARWTIGQWNAEIVTQKRREELRSAARSFGKAEEEAGRARKALDAALAERTEILRAIDAKVDAARHALAHAESLVREGQGARKALIATAPQLLRDKHAKAQQEVEHLSMTIRGLERRVNNDLAKLNAARKTLADTQESTDGHAAAAAAVAQTDATYQTSLAELTTAKERLAELQEDAGELLDLCATA